MFGLSFGQPSLTLVVRLRFTSYFAVLFDESGKVIFRTLVTNSQSLVILNMVML